MASAPAKKAASKTVRKAKGKSKGRGAAGNAANKDVVSESDAESEHGGSDAGTMMSSTRLNDIMESLKEDDDMAEVATEHCKHNKKAGIKRLLKLNVASFFCETKLGQIVQGMRGDQKVKVEKIFVYGFDMF